MRSSTLPIGRLLGRNWFKCYKCFRVEEAAYSQSASPAFGWRGRLRDPRVACLRQVKKEESRWRGSPAARL